MEAHDELLQGAEAAPTQMYTTGGLLLDYVDKKVSLTLRDGTIIVGILRSFDQFGSLVLQDTVEKIYCGSIYAERDLGVYLVRGDFVALVGEFDLAREEALEDVFKNVYRRVAFDVAEAERNKKRDELDALRKDEAARGLRKGLVGSKNTANPFYF